MISQLEGTYLLALSQVKGIGNRALQAIHEHNLSFQEVWEKPSVLVQYKIVDQGIADLIQASRRYSSPNKYLDEACQLGINYITRWQLGYPVALEDLYDAPAVIYYRGRTDLLEQMKVAVVGSRNATVYGKKVATLFGQNLGDADITVVSGLARGIDSCAQRAAAGTQGSTIGVLGCGIDVVYPPENLELYKMVGEIGLIISEFAPGTKPNTGNFPRRNRIIAALAQSLVVVEASEKSGALITTDYALELGREVWAVPGPITSPQSRGTNNLIRDGALLALDTGEIINNLLPGRRSDQSHDPKGINLTLEEGRIIEIVGEYPVHLDEIAAVLDFPRGELSSLLLKLELKGIITCLSGNYYARK